MRKTTLYLPDDLKASLERLASEEGRSEADLIREGIRQVVEERRRPQPRIPLVAEGLGEPTAAERVDEMLEGFGKR